MRYLVSGFNGFVAQSLLHFLNEKKEDDLYFTFLTSRKNYHNSKDIDSIRINSIDNFFDASLKHGSYAAYIHAMSSPRSRGNLRFSDNMIGLGKALNACKELQIKKFIYLSSGAVYENNIRKKKETDRKMGFKHFEN